MQGSALHSFSFRYVVLIGLRFSYLGVHRWFASLSGQYDPEKRPSTIEHS